MDLSQVTPAPWLPGQNTDGQHTVYAGSGVDVTPAWTNTARGRPMAQADAEFIALARNACDVMLRRSWGPYNDAEKWYVSGENAGVVEAAGANGPYPDPFTALVEADRWYREHIG